MPSKSHCKICNFDAGSQRMLARHVAIAHASVVYKCPLCPFVSCYKANFYRHKREIHGLSRSYCETCGFEASTLEDLIKHQETVHPGDVKKTIQKYKDERERLGVTTVLQNNFPDFQSDLLTGPGLKGKEAVNGTEHVTNVESTREIIDVDVELDENLTELIEVSPDVTATESPNMELEPLKVRRQYTCTCGLNTTNPREFLAHRRDEHGEKITIYECQYCMYATKNVQKLSRHCGLIHKFQMEQVAGIQSPEKKTPVKKPRAKKTATAEPKALVRKTKAKVNSKNATPTLLNYPSASSSPKLPSSTFQKPSPAQSPISLPATLQRPSVESEITHQSIGEEFTEENSAGTKKAPAGKYKCRNCSFSAKSKFLLVRHEKTVHLRKKFYRCQLCGYVCHEKGRYTKHIKYHSLPKTKCDFCDFETPYKWNLDRHLKNHELGGEFQCDKCSFTSHNRQSMTVHRTNHHAGSNGNPGIDADETPEEEDGPLEDTSQPFNEEEENDGDKEPEELDEMMPPEEEDLMGLQDEDGLEEDFEESDMMPEWNNDYSFESEESYRKILKCCFCPFKTIWPQALRKHQDIHKSTKKYPCHLCGVSFDSVAWLARHLSQKHHQNVNPKSLTKFYAPKKKVVFKPKSGLSAPPSSRYGMPMRQYFERPRFLNKPPMFSQISERYNKPAVSKLSNQPSRTVFTHPLVFVRPVQNGKPIHICRVCGYKTRWVSEIEKHLRVHSDEKPYSCPCCMYKCKWKGDLKRHVFKYHGEDALSLIEEPDAEDSLQDESQPPWSSERFKPPVAKRTFSSSTVATASRAKFSRPNAKQISQWKRVPTSKRSSTVLKLSKSSDQDSPLDLTKPREPEYDFEEYGSYGIPEDEEEYDNALDPEEANDEHFGNEWPDYDMNNGIEGNMARNFSSSPSRPTYAIKSLRKLKAFPAKEYGGKSSSTATSKDQPQNEDRGTTGGSRYATKRYKCTFCPFLSKTASRFHVHIIQHLNKKPFMCSACGYKSNWEWDITKHIKIKGLREENHAKAEMLITDDSGLKNYEKYNKFLVDIGDNEKEEASESTGTSSPEKTNKPTDTGDNMVVMPDFLTTGESTGENSDVLPTDMMETEFSVYDQGASNQQRIFKCKHCNFTNNEKKAVIGHLGVHAGLKPYRCKLCGMMSNWKHVIIRHVKLRHGGEMNFVEDRITYTQEGDTIKLSGVVVGGQSMSAIQKNDSSPTVFPCSLCPYTCEKHYYMQFHLKQHRPREDATLKCPLCPYWVKFKKTLTRHMKLHEMPMYVPFQEPDQQAPVQQKENDLSQMNASMVGLSQGTLQENQMITALPPQPPQKKKKRHQCEFCPYATNNMTQFLYHKQFHRPNKNAPFKCSMCSYWATHNHLIIQHGKLHNAGNISTAGLPEDGIVDSAYSANRGGEFVRVSSSPQMSVAKKPRLDFPMDEMYQAESETENKYSCTMCTYQCNDKRSLSTHYRFHQVVNTEFMDPPILEGQHVGSPSRPRGFSYFCKNCPAMFKSRSDYVTHSSFHGAWLPFSCPHCDYKARHKPHLHKHLHVHSDDYVARRESSSVPLSLGTADTSTAGPSDVAMPSYDEIPVVEKKKRAFLSDKLTSRLGLKQLKCTECPALFYKPSTFQYHVSLHGSGLEFACTICNYAVGSESGLATHLRLHHKKITVDKRNPIKILTCPNCPAIFTKQIRFEKHLSLHGENNKYTCDLCDYSVKFAANLSKHKSVHLNAQPPPVESPVKDIPVLPPPPAAHVLSPPKSTGKAEVKEAKVVKEKEKVWYNCSRCPYVQTRKDAVNSHLRRHGVRDGMACSYCDYCTMQTSFLRDHMKRHFQPAQYLKIQAYMKCGPMEIWLSDGTDKELVFKYAGEETEESSKFYPEYVEVCEEETAASNVGQDQEIPSTSKGISNLEPETNKENRPVVEHEEGIQASVPTNVEKKSEKEAGPLCKSKAKDEDVKKKLIKDALQKTKTLEVVLTDVFQQKKNFIKPSDSDGKFKIPDLSLIGTDRSSSSKSEKKVSIDPAQSEDSSKPPTAVVKTETIGTSTIQPGTLVEEKNNEKKESEVLMAIIPNHVEEVAEFMQQEVVETSSQVPVEVAPEVPLSEDMVAWTEGSGDYKDVVTDVMISGMYPETPDNLAKVTTAEDILSDKDSDETIPIEEPFIEDVPDENASAVVQENEPSAIPMEVTIF